MHPYYTSKIPTTPGIYRIICAVTGKFYIGSAVNLRDRWRRHRQGLERNGHDNSKLQRAWNKYGPNAFIFEILELILLPEMLTAREQHWFDALRPFGNRGFNIAHIAGSTLGVKYSPEACEKLSEKAKSRPPAKAETIEKWRLARQGYSHTPETRTKISNSHIGIRPFLGKTHRPETKEKQRRAKLGKKRSPETIAKMSASKTGHKPDPAIYDARRKILIVTAPDGTEHIVHGLRRFCEEHHLQRASLMRVAQGKQPYHKGWKARFPDLD